MISPAQATPEQIAHYAREASKALTDMAGGGSEMFTRIGEEYYADPELCRQRHREKLANSSKHRPAILQSDQQQAELLAHAEAASLTGVWEQAKENHLRYSDTGSDEGDIRFFGLGIAGEAGEVANFIKKRWRDGDGHDEDLQKECADVLAYTMMLAWKLGMSPADLIAMVAHKQQVFIEKMKAREYQKGRSNG